MLSGECKKGNEKLTSLILLEIDVRYNFKVL